MQGSKFTITIRFIFPRQLEVLSLHNVNKTDPTSWMFRKIFMKLLQKFLQFIITTEYQESESSTTRKILVFDTFTKIQSTTSNTFQNVLFFY